MRSPNARSGGLALVVALVACEVRLPPASAPPSSRTPASGPAQSVTPEVPRAGLALTPESPAWGELAAASRAPLRWALQLAERAPARVVGDGVLVAASDGSFALVDGRTGSLRWRGGPAVGVRWESLAVTQDVALALGGEGTIRTIDLATGASVDRDVAASDRVFAVGPALAADDGCDLELIGRDGAAIFAGRGRTDGDRICVEPAVLAAADDASAVIAHQRDGGARLERIERKSGAVLEDISVETGASVVRDPVTGLVLVMATSGSVRALRFGPGGVVARTWTGSAPRSLELRSVAFTDGPPLLLVRDGRRWTAVDPGTLVDRWTTTSDATVVLFGEVTTTPEAARTLARAGELRWLDARDGATIARRRLQGARATWIHGERVLVGGDWGTLAIDVRSGAIRWAMAARIEEVAPGGLLVTRDYRTRALGLVDAAAATRRFHTDMPAWFVARFGDLTLVVTPNRSRLAAYADDASPLATDPVEALAPACDSRHASLAEIEKHRGCHPHFVRDVRFAAGSAAPSGPVIARLAREWRTAASQAPGEPHAWPTLLVRGERSASEPPELAERRAAAIRDALIERGVPCSSIHAAGDPDPGRARVELTWLSAVACIL